MKTPYAVMIDGVRYVFDAELLRKKNGSPFFTRKEAIQVYEELGIHDKKDWIYPRMTDSDEIKKKRYEIPDDEMWRFPTMVELETIIDIASLRLGNPNELPGSYFASMLGVDLELGKELVSGATRYVTDKNGCYIWADPIESPGCMHLSEENVEFCYYKDSDFLTQSNNYASDDDLDAHDIVPDSEPGYCILLVRTEEMAYDLDLLFEDSDHELKYNDFSFDISG